MKAQKVVKVVLGAVVTGAVLYWGGVNAILASPLGPKILNQKPELVQFRYQRAYTLIPLQLEIDGLELSLQDRLVQISVTADHASGEIRLWKLAQQRLEAAHVVGTGVTMHIRPRMDLANAHDLGELPPINGFATPVRDILPIEVDPNQVRFIVLALQDVTVHHFRELWVDRIRYEGDAEVSGGLLFEPFKLLRLDDVHLVDAQSKVTIGPSPAAHFDTFDARITLGNFALNSIDLKQLSTLDADVLISADAEPRFLNDYLSNAPGLSTVSASGSPGHLELTAKVKKGVVSDGATLDYTADAFKLHMPLADVSGAAKIAGTVEDGRIAVRVGLRGARVDAPKGAHLFTARRFGLEAGSSAEITKVIDVDARFEVEGGSMPELTVLNAYIPAGAGIHFMKGSGEVEGKLSLDPEGHGHGNLLITSAAVTLQNRTASLTGRARIEGKIKSMSLRTGAMDLSGSSVAIDDVTARAGGETYPHFWLHAVADPCLLTPSKDLEWSTTLDLSFSNLQPALAVLSANVPVPKLLLPFTNSPDVVVSADILVRKDGVGLPRFELRSKVVQVNGALALKEVAEKSGALEPWGNVLAKVGALRAGLEFNGPKDVNVVLLGLDSWAVSHGLASAQVQ